MAFSKSIIPNTTVYQADHLGLHLQIMTILRYISITPARNRICIKHTELEESFFSKSFSLALEGGRQK